MTAPWTADTTPPPSGRSHLARTAEPWDIDRKREIQTVDGDTHLAHATAKNNHACKHGGFHLHEALILQWKPLQVEMTRRVFNLALLRADVAGKGVHGCLFISQRYCCAVVCPAMDKKSRVDDLTPTLSLALALNHHGMSQPFEEFVCTINHFSQSHCVPKHKDGCITRYL